MTKGNAAAIGQQGLKETKEIQGLKDPKGDAGNPGPKWGKGDTGPQGPKRMGFLILDLP